MITLREQLWCKHRWFSSWQSLSWDKKAEAIEFVDFVNSKNSLSCFHSLQLFLFSIEKFDATLNNCEKTEKKLRNIQFFISSCHFILIANLNKKKINGFCDDSKLNSATLIQSKAKCDKLYCLRKRNRKSCLYEISSKLYSESFFNSFKVFTLQTLTKTPKAFSKSSFKLITKCYQWQPQSR